MPRKYFLTAMFGLIAFSPIAAQDLSSGTDSRASEVSTAPHPAVGPVLAKIDAVNQQGRFKADWESLQGYQIPQWYKNAKFGIFIHWGPYSVPAFASEWYPRQMYIKEKRRGNDFFNHHLENYGSHDQFGYKDFIPQFKAENFDAARWAKLFQEAGARYVIPVAEHHDGFPMYDCSFTRWKSTQMGPKRDVIAELAEAVRDEGMKFGLSSHRAFNWMFYVRDKAFDNADPQYADLYGRPMPFLFKKGADKYKLNFPPQDQQFKDDWLARSCELVDRYAPDVFWFDFGIAPDRKATYDTNHFAGHLKRFSAYYYNQTSNRKDGLGVINYKWNAFPESAAVLDKERSKMAGIREPFWQTDTAVSSSSWGYTQNQRYKTPDRLVDDLVDIVSKNGCLLLNVGPRADGTIPEQDQSILRAIGGWLKINGEAIYDTTYWKVFGEGSTKVSTGHVAESKDKPFNAGDIRFTQRDENLYAIGLAWPQNHQVTIQSLAAGSEHYLEEIASISLLGSDEKLSWSREPDGLTVELPKDHPSEFAYVLKILPAQPKYSGGTPVAPKGYRWVQNDDFSDEFDGNELDYDKWHDHSPRWEGRAPGRFMPSSVSVKDGALQIRCSVLDPPIGKFNVACGAVQSKSEDARYGYYECRMKASSISTSSTFWLFSPPIHDVHGTRHLELDIQECIGNPQRWASFGTQMKSNTHQNFYPRTKRSKNEPQATQETAAKKIDDTRRTVKKGNKADLNSRVNDAYHTYGCWWVDANTMHFFADGQFAFTIRPPTDLSATPFAHPMLMNLVCETYDWETPPTEEELRDDQRNTTYYDYVRSYQLVKGEPPPEIPDLIDRRQHAWYLKYRRQLNAPDPSAMFFNHDREPELQDGFTELFNGENLDGWKPIGGTSTFEVREGKIVGTCLPGAKSTYLCTERDDFQDFIFTCEMNWVVDGNSGVMFRAKTRPNPKAKTDSDETRIVFGPQVEMEDTEGNSKGRHWSGGVYGQSCGGYFYPLWLKKHADARTAFKKGQWNRVTISAQGNVVKTWINGVPIAHWVDDGSYPRGFFGLQIHSGKAGTIQWKNLRIKELNND